MHTFEIEITRNPFLGIYLRSCHNFHSFSKTEFVEIRLRR